MGELGVADELLLYLELQGETQSSFLVSSRGRAGRSIAGCARSVRCQIPSRASPESGRRPGTEEDPGEGDRRGKRKGTEEGCFLRVILH